MPPRDLGRYHWSTNLQHIVASGLLATGDAPRTAKVRGQYVQIAGFA